MKESMTFNFELNWTVIKFSLTRTSKRYGQAYNSTTS